MPKSKILIFSQSFLYSGSENVIENIIKSRLINETFELKFYYGYNKRYQQGIDIKFSGFKNVFPIHVYAPFSRYGYDASLATKKIEKLTLKTLYYLGVILDQLFILNAINAVKLFWLFRKEKPNILYINNGGYPASGVCRVAVLSAKWAGIKKIVFNVNNLALPQKTIVDKIYDNYIGKSVDVFVTASLAAQKKLIKERKFKQQQCRVIPNTLTVASEQTLNQLDNKLPLVLDIVSNEIILGSVGLLTYRKGYHILIEAIALVKKDLPEKAFKLVVFGEGEDRPRLEALIQKLNLDDVVFLPGSKKDVLHYVKGYDIFVSSSIANEDFPYVIIEAMALGKAVIGTTVAGIPEQVDNHQTGLIVQENNAEALAEAIKYLLINPSLISKFGEAGLEKYHQQYNNHQIMVLYSKLFNSLNA